MRGPAHSCRLAFAVAFVASMVTAVTVLPTRQADAALSCGGKGNYKIGYGWSPSYPEFEGAEATTRTKGGLPCFGDGTFANHEGIAFRVANYNLNCWMTSGYRFYNGGTGRRVVGQWTTTDCGAPIGAIGPVTGVGGLHTYTVGVRASCQCLVAKWEGGDLIVGSGMNPDTWARPSKVAWYGSAAYRESDIPGIDTDKAHFDNMRAERQSDDVWISSPCGMATFNQNSLNRWGQDKPACNDAHVWTFVA